MRIAPAITLSAEERTRLESQARSRSLPVRVAERARIVLLAASGQPDKEIAASMAITPKKVSRWRKRFLALGVAGLQKDAPRPGRKPTIGARLTKRVVTMTTRQATQQRNSLEHSYHGCGGRHQRSQRAAHLARPRAETASRGNFQDQQRSCLRGETGRHRRPVSRSARTRAGVVRRREEPDSSSGSYPARLAAEARTRRHHDARLQTKRHGHSVCRAECGQRRSLWPVPGAASPPGMAQVSPPDRPDHPGGSTASPDLR